MNTRRTFRLVDWLLVAVIGVFLVGAVIAQAHAAPNSGAATTRSLA